MLFRYEVITCHLLVCMALGHTVSGTVGSIIGQCVRLNRTFLFQLMLLFMYFTVMYFTGIFYRENVDHLDQR